MTINYKMMRKNDLAKSLIKTYYDLYYGSWSVNHSVHPIESSAFLVTFWPKKDPRYPYATPLQAFHRMNWEWILRPLVKQASSEPVYLQKQHFGFAAVDYVGSRYGYREEGPHVHGLWIVHPELRQKTVLRMNMVRTVFHPNFDMRRIKPTGQDLYETARYCLKGIMNEDGFYRDRSDQWMPCGPKCHL